MASQTGRTTKHYVNFIVTDSANALRALPINSLNGVGLEYDEEDVTAWADGIKNILPSLPGCEIEVSGPFDNSAAITSPSMSGSHTVLAPIVGDGLPHTIDIQVGIRHAWEVGEPQFGLTRNTTNNSGATCTSYSVDLENMSYTAKFVFMGATAPAWGTAAETAGG